MHVLRIRKDARDSKFLHLLDLKNMKVIFSKDRSGVRVEVCETRDRPPYVASLKFSFYISEKEYEKITKKHKGIVQRMMRDLSDLSKTIEELYNNNKGTGEDNFGSKKGKNAGF